jgi:hypothetical protein
MADERSRQIMTGMFRDREGAERAYGCLATRGYGKDDVSLLLSDEARNRHFPKTAVTTELGSKAAVNRSTVPPRPVVSRSGSTRAHGERNE